MILSDRDIKKYITEKKLVFKPNLSNDQIGPASVDLKLGNILKYLSKENILHSTLRVVFQKSLWMR
jgi:deoxycytidine triphosphate deaminase